MRLLSEERSAAEVFAGLRAREFAGLDRLGDAYLDYTGAALPPRSLLTRHMAVLDRAPIGNPHSRNPASLLATELIEQARRAVLAFFGVDERTHTVIFTANASAAIKLVGEAFPFDAGSVLVLSADNHNSVNGLREFLRPWAGRVRTLPLDGELRLVPDYPLPDCGPSASLLAFPAQSNFSGVCHPLALVSLARERGYRTLLDAAAYVPTHRLDLGAVPADFTAVSFYKMFGYPTGVGALVARREALELLVRPWFAGGTVDFASVQHRRHQWRQGPERFEDGTPDFLGIAAIADGLGFMEEVGVEAIGEWALGLTGRLIGGLSRLRLADGRPAVDIHGPASLRERGGTVAFSLRRPDGGFRWYEEVEALAARERIHLRGGCFCNPGAAEAAFEFAPERTAQCLDRLGPDFSVARFAECLGGDRPVGALRVSVGMATSEGDVDRFLDFAARLAAGADG